MSLERRVIYVSPEEWKVWRLQAEADGLSISGYIRRRVTGDTKIRILDVAKEPPKGAQSLAETGYDAGPSSGIAIRETPAIRPAPKPTRRKR
jgi:hypothetical protein